MQMQMQMQMQMHNHLPGDLRFKVPPVGFEPTLRTLLGGRPLPLGYGGAPIITRFRYLYDKA
jgi:hypothetical protein